MKKYNLRMKDNPLSPVRFVPANQNPMKEYARLVFLLKDSSEERKTELLDLLFEVYCEKEIAWKKKNLIIS